MKYKCKKMTVLSLLICLFTMAATGCSSTSAAGDETNEPTKLEAPEQITDEAEETEPDSDSDAADETEANDDSDAADEAEPENGSDAADEAESSGKWHAYDADLAAAVDADFEGSVYEINTDSFFILPLETSLMEDGSLLTVETAPGAEISDEELVKVIFDNNTVFTMRDIYDGGARYEDSDASFQNIEKDISVSLKGNFQNDIFHANEIRIIKVH